MPVGRGEGRSRELAPRPSRGQTTAGTVVSPMPCLLTPGPGRGRSLWGRGPTRPQSPSRPPAELTLSGTPVFLSTNVTVPGTRTVPSRKLYLCRVRTVQNRQFPFRQRSRGWLRTCSLVHLTREQSKTRTEGISRRSRLSATNPRRVRSPSIWLPRWCRSSLTAERSRCLRSS